MAAAGDLDELGGGLRVEHRLCHRLREDPGGLAAQQQHGASYPIPRVPHEDPGREREGLQEARDPRVVMQSEAVALGARAV